MFSTRGQTEVGEGNILLSHEFPIDVYEDIPPNRADFCIAGLDRYGLINQISDHAVEK